MAIWVEQCSNFGSLLNAAGACMVIIPSIFFPYDSMPPSLSDGFSVFVRELEQPRPGHLAALSSLFGVETITVETIEATYTLLDGLMQEMDKAELYCLPTVPILTSIICDADEDRYVSRIPRRVSTQWSFKTKQSLESSCIKKLVESLYLLTSTVNEPD